MRRKRTESLEAAAGICAPLSDGARPGHIEGATGTGRRKDGQKRKYKDTATEPFALRSSFHSCSAAATFFVKSKNKPENRK